MPRLRNWQDHAVVACFVGGLVALTVWQLYGNRTHFTAEQIAAFSDPIYGPVRVIDGDTLVVKKTWRIRLYGIDAPETKQTCQDAGQTVHCGIEARDALIQLIGGQSIGCDIRDYDRYSRIVAVCRLDNGQDINAEMVREGWALAYREYSTDYVPQEQEARAAKRGLWSETFIDPWDWRKQH
jgi:endonuclease YncB( thermonuclease family)